MNPSGAGGPAPEKVTNLIYENTTKISSYKICNGVPDVDLTKAASYDLGTGARPRRLDPRRS